MARTQAQTRTQTQAQTPIPKSSLGGAPGANTQGGQKGGQNGSGGQQPLNRATRRTIVRAQEAARSGDARLAAQILASIPGVAAGSTTAAGQQNNGQQNNGQQNNGQRTQTPPQSTQSTRGQHLLPATPGNVNNAAFGQLIQSMPAADAARVENLSAVVLLTALRELDLTALSTADVFTICRQSLAISLTFVAMSSATPVNTQAQQNQRTQTQQNQNQTQQTRTQNQPQSQGGTRASRRKNRQRQAQHA